MAKSFGSLLPCPFHLQFKDDVIIKTLERQIIDIVSSILNSLTYIHNCLVVKMRLLVFMSVSYDVTLHDETWGNKQRYLCLSSAVKRTGIHVHIFTLSGKNVLCNLTNNILSTGIGCCLLNIN